MHLEEGSSYTTSIIGGECLLRNVGATVLLDGLADT